MSNLQLDYFKPEYIEAYKPRQEEIDAGILAFKAELIQQGHSSIVLVIYDPEAKETVAMMGILPCWPGVSEGWLLAAESIKKHRFFCVRMIKNFIQLNMTQLKINRLQCSVNAVSADNQRFVEWLGFEREGLMRKYGPGGTDFYRYAVVI